MNSHSSDERLCMIGICCDGVHIDTLSDYSVSNCKRQVKQTKASMPSSPLKKSPHKYCSPLFSFACRVVVTCRPFSRRHINLAIGISKPHSLFWLTRVLCNTSSCAKFYLQSFDCVSVIKTQFSYCQTI